MLVSRQSEAEALGPDEEAVAGPCHTSRGSDASGKQPAPASVFPPEVGPTRETLKRYEQALRESEERLRIITDLTSDYTYLCEVATDGSISIESVTEGFSRVTGYTAEEARSLDIWQGLIHADDVPTAKEVSLAVLRGNRTMSELRLITRTGEVRWIRYSILPIWNAERSRVVQMIGAVQDITDRKKAELALKDSEERFRSFMDNNPAIAFLRDQDGRYVYHNRTHARYFQRSAGQWLGKTLYEVFPPGTAEVLAAHDAEVLASGQVLRTEEQVPTPDGVLRDWLVFKFPVQDASGRRLLGCVGVDITERKALSRRLMEVQEAERRAFARELHDEVGQELTGLSLVLKSSLALPPEDARASLQEAQTLVKDLLSRVRDLSLRWRPTMLDDLGLLPALLWLIDRYGAQSRIQVHFEHEGLERRFPPPVETAAYRIVQEALTNVARHAQVDRVALRVWLGLDVLCLQIEDSGKGFDPRLQGQNPASGGISGMQERARLLGGRLALESAPGRGTRLTAELPVRNPEDAEIDVRDHRTG
jgi:PAS domain S-box-containing protein